MPKVSKSPSMGRSKSPLSPIALISRTARKGAILTAHNSPTPTPTPASPPGPVFDLFDLFDFNALGSPYSGFSYEAGTSDIYEHPTLVSSPTQLHHWPEPVHETFLDTVPVPDSCSGADYAQFCTTLGTASHDMPGFDYSFFASTELQLAGLPVDSTEHLIDNTLVTHSVEPKPAAVVTQPGNLSDASRSPCELVRPCPAVESEPTVSSTSTSTSATDPEVTVVPIDPAYMPPAANPKPNNASASILEAHSAPSAAADDTNNTHIMTSNPEQETADSFAANSDAVPDVPSESQDAHAAPVGQDSIEDAPTEAPAAVDPLLRHDKLVPQVPNDRYFAFPLETPNPEIDYKRHRQGTELTEKPKPTEYVVLTKNLGVLEELPSVNEEQLQQSSESNKYKEKKSKKRALNSGDEKRLGCRLCKTAIRDNEKTIERHVDSNRHMVQLATTLGVPLRLNRWECDQCFKLFRSDSKHSHMATHYPKRKSEDGEDEENEEIKPKRKKRKSNKHDEATGDTPRPPRLIPPSLSTAVQSTAPLSVLHVAQVNDSLPRPGTAFTSGVPARYGHAQPGVAPSMMYPVHPQFAFDFRAPLPMLPTLPSARVPQVPVPRASTQGTARDAPQAFPALDPLSNGHAGVPCSPQLPEYLLRQLLQLYPDLLSNEGAGPDFG